MKGKTIGIIGGAGPLAGATLLQRVLTFSQSLYGCYRNSDFPKVLCLEAMLKSELKLCLKELRQNIIDPLDLVAKELLKRFFKGDDR